jgi:orotate phosphoribosyltransferase
MIQNHYGPIIAKKALELEAIKLNVKVPFTWASGYRMPIYNDNRRLLNDATTRRTIAEGFKNLIEQLKIDVDNIAGTATAGIPHATTLADLLGKPLSYVRSSGKSHGLGNVIEGLGSDGSYQNQNVLLIEDLISTGGSSIRALDAIREADGVVSYCLAIFTYSLKASLDAFSTLTPPCTLVTLLSYDELVATALRSGYVDSNDAKELEKWKADPFKWGEGR